MTNTQVKGSELLTKTICILANSVKHGGRCIAGIEVQMLGNSIQALGNWIRPISMHDNGQIMPRESKLGNKAGGAQPELLDIVEIPFVKKADSNGQSENWLMHPSMPWRFRGKLKPDGLSLLAETPANLWNDGTERQDRVSEEAFQQRKLSSLCLVQVEGFTIEIIERMNMEEDRVEKKHRAKFIYQGCRYDLALTDPIMKRRYFPTFPNTPVGVIQGPSSSPYLCISMTPGFMGFHYKLVAAVFE